MRDLRKDVIAPWRAELKVPIVRYPGGNFVPATTEDGIGTERGARQRRTELAWFAIEDNQVGTDEFCEWSRPAYGCDDGGELRNEARMPHVIW